MPASNANARRSRVVALGNLFFQIPFPATLNAWPFDAQRRRIRFWTARFWTARDSVSVSRMVWFFIRINI